jgi:quinol monooxygenase YgiN
MDYAREIIPRERHIPGNLSFDILHDVHDSDTFLMLERWLDRAALDAHLNSAEFAQNEERISRFFDGDPAWEEYEV